MNHHTQSDLKNFGKVSMSACMNIEYIIVPEVLMLKNNAATILEWRY